MKNIKTYIDYINEKNIIVGDNLEKLLINKKDNFSKNLLAFLNSDSIKDEFGFVKIDWFDENENLMSLFDDKGKERKVKLGKLLKVMGFDRPFNEYEINNFIVSLKKGDSGSLKLMSGEDIYWVYDCKNYADVTSYSQLHSSCMRFSDKSKFLEIYAANPNQVSVLALIKDNKVYGRALVWNNGDKKFMDRIYCANPTDVVNFSEYAKKNNFSDKPFDIVLDKKGEYDYYPYMDTLEYYYPEEGRLSNNNDGDALTLKNTDGTATGGNAELVFSTYYNEYINKDEAVYSEISGDWYYDSDENLHSNTLYDDCFISTDTVDFAVKGLDIYTNEYVFGSDIYMIEHPFNKGQFLSIFKNEDTLNLLNDDKTGFDYDKLKEELTFIDYINLIDEYIYVNGINIKVLCLAINADSSITVIEETEPYFDVETSEKIDYSEYYIKDVCPILYTEYDDEIYRYINSIWVHESLLNNDNNHTFKHESKYAYSMVEKSYLYKKEGEFVQIDENNFITIDAAMQFNYEKVGNIMLSTIYFRKEDLELLLKTMDKKEIIYKIDYLSGVYFILKTSIGEIRGDANVLSLNNKRYPILGLIDFINSMNEKIYNFDQYIGFKLKLHKL